MTKILIAIDFENIQRRLTIKKNGNTRYIDSIDRVRKKKNRSEKALEHIFGICYFGFVIATVC